jgi:hypothetical protein
MHQIFPLYCLLATAACLAMITPINEGYNLNLTLVGEIGDQYWVLTEENFPPNVSRIELSSESSTTAMTPSSDTVCDVRNRAPAGDCLALINALEVDQRPVPRAPRHIAWRTCFVSWHTPTEASMWEFHGVAHEIFRQCNFEGGVSGRHLHTYIGQSKDMIVCLSNRQRFC